MLLNNKHFIIAKFNTLWPKDSPSYRAVKSRDPDLFEAIIAKFHGYRAFLRKINRPMPTTTKRDRAFINLSSKCSNNYHNIGWSSLEERVWAILAYIGVAQDFIHNFPFISPSNRYYKLDFYNPTTHQCIEVDGVFHRTISHQLERDLVRDEYLRSFGMNILRLTGKDISSPNIITIIGEFIRES